MLSICNKFPVYNISDVVNRNSVHTVFKFIHYSLAITIAEHMMYFQTLKVNNKRIQCDLCSTNECLCDNFSNNILRETDFFRSMTVYVFAKYNNFVTES